MRESITMELIKSRQAEWARNDSLRQGQKMMDDAHRDCVDHNLREALDPNSRLAFMQGRGGELDGEKPKMSSVISSSALAVNVFSYWNRVGRINEIAEVCGFRKGAIGMSFEGIYHTPLRSKPHLDVDYWWTDGWRAGIESKFTEPYNGKSRVTDPERKLGKYVESKSAKMCAFWNDAPGIRGLAAEIAYAPQDQPVFNHLDAAQLIKHAIGMATKCGMHGFNLLYLWYSADTDEVKTHIDEISQFKAKIGNEINFSHMTYQDLFAKINRLVNVDQHYQTYLRDRYF